ncbi:xanthine dehydrogenase family protein molybdopterin-binding subunit [Acuticoccus sp.]|uniref:xanthine dehydrogenase family protein molybdopterin-binding subunit n=1 Tax=Acuticoccus sp. TaxID=1904378 RepID=UPI003B52A3DE
MRHVGERLPRLGTEPLLAGHGRTVGDVMLAHQVHMHVVRSPVAAGLLEAVDVEEASHAPGVVAVLTGADVAELPTIPLRADAEELLGAPRQPVLAGTRVRYIGEPVAAVFAESLASAEDAAELVVLSITPTPAAVGSQPEARPYATPEPPAPVQRGFGDPDRAFRNAARIVEVTLGLARDGAVPLEPRGLVARWDAGRDLLEVWGAGRGAHAARATLAAALDLPLAAVRWHATDVGGSFGARGAVAPEDVLVAHAARLLERPVRWIEGRRENLEAAPRGRGVTARARAAVSAAGDLVGLDVDVEVDQGAYVGADGTSVGVVLDALTGPYAMASFRATGRARLTNTPPAGRMRGAGTVEATFVRERIMDAVAAALGVDGLALRRDSLAAITEAEHRQPSVAPRFADEPPASPLALLDAGAKAFSLDRLRRRVAARRADGELVGMGIAIATEPGPCDGFAHVSLALDARGGIEAVTGASEEGQGTAALVAQVAADVLGVGHASVRVRTGETDRTPAPRGGWHASVALGTAAQFAAEALRDKVLAAAGQALGLSCDRLTIQSDRVREADGHGGASVALADLAAMVEAAARDGGGLAADGWHRMSGSVATAALIAAVVEVDRGTGLVAVRGVHVAADVGTPVNPALVEAQIVGAVAHGLGGALGTGLPHGPSGEPVCVGLRSYGMPTAADVPAVEVFLHEDDPSRATPLGLRGVGHVGIAGVGPAIAAAVDDALQSPGFVTTLPLSPAAILREVRSRSPVAAPA